MFLFLIEQLITRYHLVTSCHKSHLRQSLFDEFYSGIVHNLSDRGKVEWWKAFTVASWNESYNILDCQLHMGHDCLCFPGFSFNFMFCTFRFAGKVQSLKVIIKLIEIEFGFSRLFYIYVLTQFPE